MIKNLHIATTRLRNRDLAYTRNARAGAVAEIFWFDSCVTLTAYQWGVGEGGGGGEKKDTVKCTSHGYLISGCFLTSSKNPRSSDSKIMCPGAALSFSSISMLVANRATQLQCRL